MKRITAVLVILSLLICCAGCDKQPATDTVAESGQNIRETVWEPEVKPLDNVANFSDGVCALMPEAENYMFSPLSAQIAFAMVANGARDETRAELLKALGIEDLDAYNQKMTQLMQTYAEEGWMELKLANGLWLQYADSVKADFAERMRTFYGAEVATVTPETAADAVNGWVRENTNGKIEGITDGDFDFLLANATYMKADWESPFEASDTRKKQFRNIDGTETETDFMYQKNEFKYAEHDGVRILELPYQSRDVDVSMYVLLGDGTIKNPQGILEKAEFEQKEVQVYLPKFEQEFSMGLNGILRSLGAERAFDSVLAQIDGILTSTPLYIESSKQKTYIRVDEKGTEAAAVTAVELEAMSAMPEEPPIEFRADKPFTYVIRDNTNGEILFVGAYVTAK